MRDLSYVSQEISKGRNLDTNLKAYANGLSAMYHGLAYIKLSMNYYTVYDMCMERSAKNPEFDKLMQRFQKVIADQVLTHKTTGIEEISGIRDDIIKIMEHVTSYVDRLRIYEYVLNRVEYRFTEEEPDEDYYGMYLTNDLMHYIFSDKDNVVINSKISEVVGQLPMRLSRPKFYEYIRDAFTLYHGAQKGTVNDFVYALKTSAMIDTIREGENFFPEMDDICATLANADYKNITQEEYQRLKGALTIGSEQMNDIADLFVLLAQIVNDAYTIILTYQDDLGLVEEVETAKDIITSVNNAFIQNQSEIEEDVIDKFTLFEGKQERIMSVVSQCDFAVEIARANFKEQLDQMNLTSTYAALSDTMKLQSGSDFVNLVVSEEKNEVPDDSFADEACKSLIDELDKEFQEQPQIIRRAVMSAVLSQLPVFFNSTQEIQEYINLSLEQCHDKAEKMAVIEVMKMIVQDNV